MMRIAGTAAIQLEARWRNTADTAGDPAAIAEIFTWMFERSCHQMLRNGESPDRLAAALAEIIWRVISPLTPAR